MLHTQTDFDRMAAKVKSGAQPWVAGWNRLATNSVSQSTWKANPLTIVYRGSGYPENYGTLYYDIHAAYQNALRWKVTGDTAHADAARDILNAWSSKLTKVDGNADRFIAAGIYGYQFANAGEIMRGYPGFALARFQQMMLTIFYPMSSNFLAHHNNALVTNYWGSWDLLSMACVMAVGILCDDQAKVNEAVTYFKSGAGNGAIKNLIPVILPDGLAQWVEVGRDQGHATLGVGLAGTIAEMAWNQGIDLYGYDDNRLLKGFEYVAKWNLGQNVTYPAWTWNYGSPGVWSGSQTLTSASTDSRGVVRPIWEMIYNHYVNRRGLAAPYVTAIAAHVRPEGGGGNYGGNSGGFDQLGFGTLAFTREKATSAHSGVTTVANSSVVAASNSTSKRNVSAMTGVYGSVLDAADPPLSLLNATHPPPALPQRPDGVLRATVNNTSPRIPGSLSGTYIMHSRGQNLTIEGTGYFQIRWEVAYFNIGGMVKMPTFSGLKGELYHVASGGGHRSDDLRPKGNGIRWTGNASDPKHWTTFPKGSLIPWQNEYYYLNGSVTITENERYPGYTADYNIAVTFKNHTDVVKDINSSPYARAPGNVRYGIVRDTGLVDAPIPQYLTREVTTNTSAISQKSDVILT